MKVTWEIADIKCGRRARKPGTSETLIIGYDASIEPRTIHDAPANRTITSLSDGSLIAQRLSNKEVAEFLNKAELLPLELLPEVPIQIG